MHFAEFQRTHFCTAQPTLLLQFPTKTWKYSIENNMNFLVSWFGYLNYSEGVNIHVSTWNMESHKSFNHVMLKTTNLPFMLSRFITLFLSLSSAWHQTCLTGMSYSFQCCHLKSNADCEFHLGLQKKNGFNDSLQSMPLKNSKLIISKSGISWS